MDNPNNPAFLDHSFFRTIQIPSFPIAMFCPRKNPVNNPIPTLLCSQTCIFIPYIHPHTNGGMAHATITGYRFWVFWGIINDTSSTAQGGGGSFKDRTQSKGELLWCMDGRSESSDEPKGGWNCAFEVVAMVAVVTSPTTAGCSAVLCSCSRTCSVMEL